MEALYYATDKTPKILLDPDTLKFAFQPIFSAKTGEIFGYEGLMRPANCTPKELIDAYAKVGKLERIEEATFFGGIQTFLDLGLEGNLFLNSFPSECLSVAKSKELAKIDGNRLTGRLYIELLEYTNLNPMAWHIKRQSLINSGAKPHFAIDDFGSGKHLDIQSINLYRPELIKIDRKFISNIDTDKKKQATVRDMIRTFHARGIKALAEGIETEAEYNYLKTTDIDFLQGFYLGMPEIYE